MPRTNRSTSPRALVYLWPSEVEAVLAGAKQHFRRPIRPQPETLADGHVRWAASGHRGPVEYLRDAMTRGASPFGQRGQILCVCELWAAIRYARAGLAPIECVLPAREVEPTAWSIIYAAGAVPVPRELRGFRWRSPLAMPRWASRITLTVREVRVERLWEIDEASAYAEGCPRARPTAAGYTADRTGTYREGYAMWWEATYGTSPTLSWAANPWVWTVAFDAAVRPPQARSEHPEPAEASPPARLPAPEPPANVVRLQR